MANPTHDEFLDLKEQVDRLTALVTAQAAYHQQLAAFAAPAQDPGEQRLYSKAEACKVLSVSRSTFDQARKDLGIKQDVLHGRSPKFSQRTIDRISNHLAKS